MASAATTPFDTPYFAPVSIAEAIALLALHDGTARLLAGGQTLIPQLHQPGDARSALIDLRLVPGLAEIRPEAAHVAVGAMVTISGARDRLADSFPIIRTCFGHVANSAVRNRATLGGSLAVADPASEISTFLIAYEAEAVLAGGSESTVSVRDLLEKGGGGALISAIRIPLPRPGERAGFAEILRRRSGGRSLAMALARLHPDAASLTVSGGMHQPLRLTGPDAPALTARLDAALPAFESDPVRAWVRAAARRALAAAEGAAAC